MFLLSRRSAVFALFVILAFATSTLLAHTPSTAAVQLLICFDMHDDDTSWPVVSMRNAFSANKGVFTTVGSEPMKSIAFSLRGYIQDCVIEDLQSGVRRNAGPGRDARADHYRPFAFQYHLHNATIKKELFSQYSILTFSVTLLKLHETRFTPVERGTNRFLKFELKRGEEARLVDFQS
eukprot:GHVS01098634.1.p1 GENE.GHVS01098634.1~~GHVS01098634.1.p1  ORF type:complete len:199 (-),score=6.80 GHVS01098634.1:48-584(-)